MSNAIKFEFLKVKLSFSPDINDLISHGINHNILLSIRPTNRSSVSQALL